MPWESTVNPSCSSEVWVLRGFGNLCTPNTLVLLQVGEMMELHNSSKHHTLPFLNERMI